MDLSKISLHHLRHTYGFSLDEIYKLIDETLTEEEAEKLLNDWRFWARPSQLPPEGKWRFWFFCGGRSTGKTRAGSEFIIERAKAGKGPIALIGQSSGDVREVMAELGPSAIMQVCPSDFMPTYEPSKRRLTFPNGVTATTFSGDEPGQLRGPQHQTIWCDEFAKMAYPQETFEQLQLGLRIGDSRCVITSTPTPHELIKWLYRRGEDPEDEGVVLTTGTTFDNKDNVDAEYLREVEKQYKGTKLERQELYGLVEWETEDSLFSMRDIEKNRIKEGQLESLNRIAIGVDPAVSDKHGSDANGIVVAGVGEKPSPTEQAHGYILQDATLKGSPAQWASRVSHLHQYYWSLHGVRPLITIEVNQGGDMAFDTLIQHGVPQNDIKMVRATKGKLVRADPVSLLYEQGKVHHVGVFSEMEDQMISFEGRPDQKSPDSLDAMVYAITELMLGKPRSIQSKQFLV